MYAHYVLRGELLEAIVEGREAVAACGASGDPKTLRGDYTTNAKDCPVCMDVLDSQGIPGL